MRKQLLTTMALVIAFFIVFGIARTQHKTALKTAAPFAPATQTGSDDVDALRKNSKELLAIVDNQDPRAALNELQSRMDSDPVVFRNCHELAHEIGHQAIKKYGDFATALQYQETTCSDGYLHGVIEQTFGDQTGNIIVLTKKMQTLCAGLSGLTARCFHGVGHAMMYYTNNNLPKSLALCGILSGRGAQGRCYEGAYMQNFLASPDLHPSKFVDYNNPISPCLTAPSKYKPYCYFYVPIFYLSQNNNDYAKALQWCQSDKTSYAGACIKGVGSLIVKYNIKDPKYGQNLCATVADVRSCISGMVSYGLTFYNSGRTVVREMCDQMDDPYKAMCKSDLTQRVHLF